MNLYKNLGIWMDHSSANLIELKFPRRNRTIESDFTHDQKVSALNKGENLMHNKEQQLHEVYYKKIASEILKYDHVLLFGPTNAKAELHIYLKRDLGFTDIEIDVEAADKMTVNEQSDFVRTHFKNL